MLSLPHLIVIFIVALVIFGPQKLPELARMLGKATAEFRKMTGDFRYALEEEVRDLDRQARHSRGGGRRKLHRKPNRPRISRKAPRRAPCRRRTFLLQG